MKRSLLVVVFSILITAACSQLFPTQIGDVLKNPRGYAEKEVTISGEVTDVFSFVFIKYFRVKDSSGEIAVVTERPLPNKGERIRVKGIVKEAFSIGDQNITVLVESTDNPKH